MTGGDREFAARVRTLADALAADPARYHVAPADATAFADAVRRFVRHLPLDAGGESTAATRCRHLVSCAKTAARGEVRRVMRPILNRLKADRTLGDDVRAELGLPARPLTGLARWRREVEGADGPGRVAA